MRCRLIACSLWLRRKMNKKENSNIFVSDCGNYVAIRVLSLLQPAFDVCRHDGSDLWVCNRDPKGGIDRTRENCPDITKWILAWLNDGHRKRNDERVEGFIITLYDFEKEERIDVAFHTPLLSLAPRYEKRRQLTAEKEEEFHQMGWDGNHTMQMVANWKRRQERKEVRE